jgi:hypothetical protein
MAILLEDDGGFSRLIARVSGVGNRAVDAIEREMRVQIPLLADLVRANIAERFRNPTLMMSAIGEDVTRASTAVYGAVDASGRLSGVVLPFMEIQERGGTTAAHVIPRGSGFVAFQGAQGDVVRRSVNHPGSRIPPHYYLRDAVRARREPMIEAFRRVTGGALTDRTTF